MSNDRTLQVCRLDLSNPYVDEMGGRTGRYVIEVNVTYSKGGISYYDYQKYPSGYWLGMRRKFKGNDGTQQFTMFAMGESVRDLICEADRFSAKKLADLAKQAPVSDLYRKLLDHMVRCGAVLAN
jgi:hypothetical protein